MAAFNKFQVFVQDVGRKVHNLNADALKVKLTNMPPVNTNTVVADIIDIAAGNGYLAGGATVANTAYSQIAGIATLAGDNVIFTAAGGAIGPFRYAVLYNSVAVGGALIGWWDYGNTIVLNAGDTFTVDLSGNILTLT